MFFAGRRRGDRAKRRPVQHRSPLRLLRSASFFAPQNVLPAPHIPDPFRVPAKISSGHAVIGLLIALNVAVWVLALVAFHNFPILLGTAALAYGFGLKHAVDADHIAAIDNVTRKLMQEGKKPLLTGFWFSLGHSTIVVLLSLAVALTTVALKSRFDHWHDIGNVVGTSVSAAFLLLIAVFNLFVLRDLVARFTAARRAGLAKADIFGNANVHPHEHRHSILLAHSHDHGHSQALPDISLPGGPIARLLRPLFRLISRPWHMYPLGVLFGLGFDTATEIALLGISADEATKGLPVWTIMIFPALFAAGMALVDTIDGLLMVGVYGWAMIRPLRKLYYNMTITALSALIALVIGALETLGLIADKFRFSGTFWDAIGTLTDKNHFPLLGYGIIGLFVIGWLVSAAIYRWRGFDRLDADAASG